MVRSLPPVPAWTSALVAALVGFGGTIALVVQAMQNLGASVEQTGSAVTALCLGIAVAGATLSFGLRMPVVLAWSTPGAALLAAIPQLSWPVAIGAFLAANLMMTVLAAIPALGRLAAAIPASLASAMLAGVLLPFCLELFRLGSADPLLVAVLVIVFIIARARLPLYSLLLVLVSGVAVTLLRGDVGPLAPGATLGALSATAPDVRVEAIFGIALPLFLVTLMSQNLPGLAVLSAAGYDPKPRPLLLGTGLASLAAAPFGGHAINLAAITAAICTDADAHPDKARRWTVGALYALCYLVLAAFAPLLVRQFLALPPSVIAALTGVALIPAFTAALTAATTVREDRDPAILTFLVTASGLVLAGLGSAFWGIVAGFAALGMGRLLRGRTSAVA